MKDYLNSYQPKGLRPSSPQTFPAQGPPSGHRRGDRRPLRVALGPLSRRHQARSVDQAGLSTRRDQWAQVCGSRSTVMWADRQTRLPIERRGRSAHPRRERQPAEMRRGLPTFADGSRISLTCSTAPVNRRWMLSGTPRCRSGGHSQPLQGVPRASGKPWLTPSRRCHN